MKIFYIYVYVCVYVLNEEYEMWQGSDLEMDIQCIYVCVICEISVEMPVGLWCGNGDKICSKFVNMKAGVSIQCLLTYFGIQITMEKLQMNVGSVWPGALDGLTQRDVGNPKAYELCLIHICI